jgi:hypothetical protein
MDLVEGFNAIPPVTRYHLLGIAALTFGMRFGLLSGWRFFLTPEAFQLGWRPLRFPHLWRLFTNHLWIGKLDFGWLMTMFWVCVLRLRRRVLRSRAAPPPPPPRAPPFFYPNPTHTPQLQLWLKAGAQRVWLWRWQRR